MTHPPLRRETTGPANAGAALKPALVKVPQITLVFWVLKLLTTGMGESMSDFLGSKSVPIAGAIGMSGLSFAIWLQMRQREYRAPIYLGFRAFEGGAGAVAGGGWAGLMA